MEDSVDAGGGDRALSRGELLALVAATVTVAVAGTLLYLAGYNESFYSDAAWVRGVFEALTNLGDEKLYLVVFCVVFLSYDMRYGRNLAWVFFLTLFAGDFLKELVHDPRPPANDLRPEPVSGYGFPSGHTTSSVSFYGYIMLTRRGAGRLGTPLAALCMFAMVVVPVSRMVIGAHDLQDVAGGVVVSLSLLTAYALLRPRVSAALDAMPVGRRVVVQAATVLLLWGAGVLVLAVRHPGGSGTAMEGLGQATGLLLGCAIAFPLEEAYVGYRPDLLDRRRRAASALIGTLMTVGLYAATAGASDALLPPQVADLVTYLVLILLLALGAPYALKRLWSGRL